MSIILRKSRFTLALLAFMAAALAGVSGFATAGEIKITLSGDQEVPPVQTSASGTGTITVEDDKTIKGKIIVSGIKPTGVHIHEAPTGKTGDPIISLEKTGENEWSVQSGAKLTDAQYDAAKAGGLYINVHSNEHKGGEIRGQIKR
ncbi:CHRD domain-containing protein [Nitrosospira sp. Nsp2]|uniref:CHRD domain-containing protein n=1 Tax=Nitrosospira sp. Nsp2 TaxID=136548 RepID=UPI000D3203A7|nr:CHRD domain-containing protein [Nitrosospira sp. Nsp2]PTR17428.1 CHRD domain-containing protein [Nitrosospira sp. Nsp2]